MDGNTNTDLNKIISDLRLKYDDNPYMLQRIETHILNLSNILEQEDKRHIQKVTRNNELTNNLDNFCKIYLSKHHYFYMPYNNVFYEYDGKTYKIIKEDDIQYSLLSTISQEKTLIQWKHKTKQFVLKKIKENSLFKSTPETYTIQHVLNFLKGIFQTKTESKYFLTLIGDCILKKNNDCLSYFVSPRLKRIVGMIDTFNYINTGTTIMGNFITKYHDNHLLKLYRLIRTNETTNILNDEIIGGILNTIGIDLLCVATHYSERYISADNYLKNNDEDGVIKYSLFFINNSVEQIIEDFIENNIDVVSSDSFISWKNMHYIWKLHLSSINIPNMIYSQNLQSLLMSKLSNNNEPSNLIFTNITSKYLPVVSSFLSFWEKHITIANDEIIDYEYEVDELLSLFKRFDKKSSQIDDVLIVRMISHYFSHQVEIVDNKYITNIKCDMWSKTDDINDFLLLYKEKYNKGCDKNEDELISFDELYKSYKDNYNKTTKLIVSKNFFEKYVASNLSDFIEFDKFVSSIYF